MMCAELNADVVDAEREMGRRLRRVITSYSIHYTKLYENARQIDMVMLNGALYRGQDAARVYPDPTPAPKIYYFRGRADAMVGIEGPSAPPRP